MQLPSEKVEPLWLMVWFVLLGLGATGWKVCSSVKREIAVNLAESKSLSAIWETGWQTARKLAENEFAGRDNLRKIYSQVLFLNFGSTSSQEVKQGPDGWLFLSSKEGRRGMHHTHAFSDTELHQWGDTFENWRRKLAEYDAQLIVMVAPDKHTVYDELAPVHRHTDTPTRMDQLYAYLDTHTSVQVVDVRPVLRTQKLDRQVYYKTDTHWNEWGGYFAFHELEMCLQHIFPEFALSKVDDFVQEVDVPRAYDLSRLAGVDDIEKEIGPKVVHRVPTATVFEDGGKNAASNASVLVTQIRSHNPAGTIPRLLMLRDSFAVAMLPFLAANVQEGTYVLTSQLDANAVKKIRPTVVVFEIIERYLYYISPPNPLD